MRKPPETYAEWVRQVSLFACGEADADVFAVLARARYLPSAGAGERLMNRITGAVDERLRALAARMQVRFDRAASDEAVVAVLRDARREIATVRAFGALACWPKDVGTRLVAGIDDFARKTQASLEESAERNGHRDCGRLASLLRRAPLVACVESIAPPRSRAQRLRAALRTFFSFRERRRA